jgi:glutathione S-transferase
MWAALVRDVDAALEGRDWLAGDAYSLAEAVYTPYITRLDHLNLMGFVDGYPNLSDW